MADADNAAAILSSLHAAYTAVMPQGTNYTNSCKGLKHSSTPAQLTLQPSLFRGWEDSQQASDTWQEHKSYWATKMRGACCTLDLPRSVSQGKAATLSAWSVPVSIGQDAWRQARCLAVNENTEPIVVLLAALQVTTWEHQCCSRHMMTQNHQLKPWSTLVCQSSFDLCEY